MTGMAFAMSKTSRGPHEQRLVIVMFDGLGPDYLEKSDMPTLKRWARTGLFASVKAVMPTVTNANNASICCGAFPDRHGVIGNSFLDRATGAEEYLEDGALLTAPTIFERAKRHGVSSALLTSKKKTVSLLGKSAAVRIAAEAPDAEIAARYGEAPPIYSREINYWLMRAAIDLLKTRPDLGIVYVHTTDYAMHMWAPEAEDSNEHLQTLDRLLGEAADAAPDAAFLVSADHGMNYKSRCWDLEKALAARGAPIHIAISAERDKYLRHHRGMGGTSWVHLNDPGDALRVAAVLQSLDGVERVLTREQAAREFHLMASRIGDLVVLGDRDTVFGNLEQDEMELLPEDYRSHGSLHESDVPLIIHNARNAPQPGYFRSNLDLARWAYADEPVSAELVGEAV
jgi:phosphonoacetate hydrolase